jgi:glycosyltransferase involved in cell wall biosynthesis
LKILKICPTPFFSDRGCHVRILEQAKALQNLGHEVAICTYNSGRDIPGVETHRIASFGRRRKLETGPDWRKYYLDILLFFKALRSIVKKRPHIIHAHLHEGAFIAYPIARFFKIPLVLDLQGSLTDEMVEHNFIKEKTLPYRFNYWLEKRACLMADCILASSINLTTFLKNGFGLNTGRVELMEEGIKTGEGIEKSIGSAKDELKKRLGIPGNALVALYLGLLYPYQGIDDFLKAGKNVLTKRTDIHFLVIGFPGEGRYREKMEKEGLGKHFTFTGKVRYEDIGNFIALADIAISPKVSRTESNSKLYHFMAQGIPSIVYDLPVNRKILGDTGIYVKTDDVESLSIEVKRLIEDEERKKEISLSLKKRAGTFKDWMKVGRNIEKIYYKLKAG